MYADISVNIQSNVFKFSLVTLNSIMEEQCLRLFVYALDQILCNLEIKFVEKCKECPVFGHKIKTKPKRKDLRHGSLRKSS